VTLVSEAMSRSFSTVSPDASMRDASEVARRSGAEHLLVLDGDVLVGILCTCDLEAAAPEDVVSECMTLPVMTVRPDARAEDAAVTMRDADVGCLPVAVGGLLLGTLCGDDLRRAGVEARACGCHHHRIGALH
jgi:acetoin utilization protein AcuB